MPGANRKFYLQYHKGIRKKEGIISLIFVIGGMKDRDLFLLAGLGIAGYFLYKQFGDKLTSATAPITNLINMPSQAVSDVQKGVNTPGGLLGKDSATDFSAWAQAVLGLDVDTAQTAPRISDYAGDRYPPQQTAQAITDRWVNASYSQDDINFSASQIQAMLNLPSVSTTTNNGVVSYWLEI